MGLGVPLKALSPASLSELLRLWNGCSLSGDDRVGELNGESNLGWTVDGC